MEVLRSKRSLLSNAVTLTDIACITNHCTGTFSAAHQNSGEFQR
jgi:hypothetical protein